MAVVATHSSQELFNEAFRSDRQQEDPFVGWNLFDVPENNDNDLTSVAVDSLNNSNDLDSAVCYNCNPWPCLCYRLDQTYPFLPLFPHQEQQALTTLLPPTRRQRNEVSAAQRQEMESSTEAGVTAATTGIFPANPYIDTINNTAVTSAVPEANGDDMAAVGGMQSFFTTPDHLRYSDHVQSSNVRESVEEPQQPTISGPDSADRDAANILTHDLHLANGDHLTGNGSVYGELHGGAATLQQFDGDLDANGHPLDETALDMVPKETSAYAKISFADGDFLVTTHNVMLGRNMEVAKNLKRKKKAERRAREAMDSYRKEPSQPSQHEDGDQLANPSSSDQSLEGRPAPPSNVSERGGVVSYQAFAANMQRPPRQKRRSLAISKSSSTTSIDPAMIQSSITSDKRTTFDDDGEPEERTHAFIPIHTPSPEDITKISKEHLEFRFNFQIAQWEARVVGNGAIINEKFEDKGTVVQLKHNDEIMIYSVHMIFKLPDNVRASPGISHGTFSRSDDEFSDDDDLVPGTSPIGRLNDAMETGDTDDDENDTKEGVLQPKSKPKPNQKQEDLKKKTKKKPKKDPPKDDTAETAKKGKKPKAGDKSSPAAKAEKPSTPPRIEPGSTLEGIPLDELPQKRKGPGRPPKNGLVSKRDQAMVEKKKKEYEKRGEAPPSFDVLVNIVRAENKAKEQHQKALQNGEIDPGTSIMPSIEHVASYSTAKAPSGPKTTTTGQTDTAVEPHRKAASPKPQKRTELSASPIPPRESFTDDQMKKPSGTYVTILDEILRNHPDGEADLPDIYLRIQKRYPHFAYNVGTQGWQSSVRHNLLQHPRFIEKGKSGKGKFWAIDESVPIEKEQKKRKSPPAARPMHMQQPGQYGQPQYGNPYGNSQANGQPHGANQPGSAYYSPYAQAGQNAQYGGQHPSGPNGQRPNGGQTAKPKTQWDLMVDEFVKLLHWYRSTFPGKSSEEISRKETLWNEALGQLSEAFHTGIPATSPLPPAGDETDVKVLAELQALFANDKLKEAAQEQKKSMGSTVNQAVENGAASAAEASQTNGAVVANQTTAGVPDAAAQMSAAGPSSAVQAGSHPNINNRELTEGMAVEPANSVPPTASQQLSPGGAGTKRPAEDAGDDPAAKKVKGK